MSAKEEKKKSEQTEDTDNLKTDEHDKAKIETKTLEEENAELKKELEEKNDKFLRLLAEFENFKKRSAKQMSEIRKYSNENILKALLIVADNLSRAILATKTEKVDKISLGEGVEITLKELIKIFENYDVTPIDAEGKIFDPNFHQAMMKQVSEEHQENTVINELQKGYMICDRLLRPAMVIVSEKKKKDEEERNE